MGEDGAAERKAPKRDERQGKKAKKQLPLVPRQNQIALTFQSSLRNIFPVNTLHNFVQIRNHGSSQPRITVQKHTYSQIRFRVNRDFVPEMVHTSTMVPHGFFCIRTRFGKFVDTPSKAIIRT